MTKQDITSRQIPTVREAGRNPQLATIARAAAAVDRDGQARYVFATYGRWNVGTEAPATGSYYEFTSDGRWMVEA